MNNDTMWIVRAGDKGVLIDVFQNKGIVAIGHNYLGDLINVSGKQRGDQGETKRVSPTV